MRIILSNCIRIDEPTREVVEFVKKELTFKNTEYEKKKRMGFYTYGISKDIKLYNDYNGSLYVPYGFFDKLYAFYPYKDSYVDYTTTKNINIDSNISLRDYQVPGLRAIKEHYNGLFVLPCGLGKTELALQCVYELKQKAIWITHTTDLVNQAKERCDAKMTCKTSTITDGKIDTSGDIVFCTMQTLYKMIENGKIEQNMFGMLIADECHRVAANPSTIQMFRTCIDYFACRYKLGLTATLHRADGLEKCITSIIGSVIYEVVKVKNDYVGMYEGKEILRFSVDKFQVPAHIKVIETNYDISDKEVFSSNGGTIQFATLISDLGMNVERNKQILKTLKTIQGSTLVLSDRVEQLEYLCSMVDSGVCISGKTPKKQRTQALKDVASGKIKFLFASYSLAKEGLSVDILSNLVLATPVKDFAIVQQSIGRIQRLYEGKTVANVYDFVDNVGMLLRFYTKRRATYRKNGWIIDNMYLND